MPFDGLTDDQLRDAAPSVFATAPSDKVSERYAYLPSYHVVRSMRALGFAPVLVREGKKKAPDGRAFAMHEIRFQKAGEAWARQTRALGEIVPEAVFRNSHDRTSGAEMSAGIKRLVCENGMTVSDSAMHFAVRHVGNSLTGNFLTAVQAISNQFARVVEVARRWQAIDLSPEQVRQLHRAALKARGTELAVSDWNLSFARRPLDQGSDLWSVFNRIQENITRGGLIATNASGALRTLRGITSLTVDIDFNKRLWQAASDLADNVRPVPVTVVG